MHKEIMKKWVKALRSGKFKQGTGTLKQYNSKGQEQHCCLGVLCELYNDTMRKNKKKTLPEKVFDNDYNFSHGYCKFGSNKDNLPKEIMEWAGIKDSVGEFKITVTDGDGNEYYEIEILADLNDTGRKFKTIADIIEKNYERL